MGRPRKNFNNIITDESEMNQENIVTVEPEKQENIVTVAAEKKSNDFVFVWLNNHIGLNFKINGKTVSIASSSQRLRGKETGTLPVGEFECTRIEKNVWREIVKQYGSMKIFKNGLIFATNSDYDGRLESVNRASLRHGLEPVDPAKTETTKA